MVVAFGAPANGSLPSAINPGLKPAPPVLGLQPAAVQFATLFSAP
jgi:hypothetical protein